MNAYSDDYSIRFEAWILPVEPLFNIAKVVGDLFSVPLQDHFTESYDEYPAYEIVLDSYASIRLLGVPPDIESLLINWPSEFNEKDRNYSLCISLLSRIPFKNHNGFSLPYANPEEFLLGCLAELRRAGLSMYSGHPAFVQLGTSEWIASYRTTG